MKIDLDPNKIIYSINIKYDTGKDSLGNIPKLNEYINKAGMWSLIGKDNSGVMKCLEVGITKDIRKELRTNIRIILNPERYKVKRKSNKRYEAKKLFDYSESFYIGGDENRRIAKYKDIRSKYSELYFCKVGEVEDKDKCTWNAMLKEEMMFAVENKALYWNAWGAQANAARAYYNKIKQQNIC